MFCWYNFRFREVFSVIRHDQTIKPIVCDCHKGSTSHHKSLFAQWMDHSNFTYATSNILENLELFDLYVKIHLSSVFPLPIFMRWSDLWSEFCTTIVYRYLLIIANERPLPTWSSRLYLRTHPKLELCQRLMIPVIRLSNYNWILKSMLC